MKELKEPTSLLSGITHAEMLAVMHHKQILCSVECFRSVLQWAQQRMYESMLVADVAKREASLTEMVRDAEALDLYSERECGCQTCRPITMTDMRMVVCQTCGNKRCPKATDHRLACTNSNEPGQPGSSYGVPLETANAND